MHHRHENPLSLVFLCLRPLWCIPFFPELGCIPFSLFFQEMVHTIVLFGLLCDLRVGRQTGKGGLWNLCLGSGTQNSKVTTVRLGFVEWFEQFRFSVQTFPQLKIKQKGGFIKGQAWRMYPRSGFWYKGTRPKHLVGNHLCANPQKYCRNPTRFQHVRFRFWF